MGKVVVQAHSRGRTPLIARLKSKTGSPPSRLLCKARSSKHQNITKSRSPSSSPSSINIYIGENFAVQLHKYFKLCHLIQNKQDSGVIHTEFDVFRNMDRMKLSQEAQKIKDVPNAGGTSVISEVLSYEVLRRCFGATLLKVSKQ
jgi:hypothetical protein